MKKAEPDDVDGSIWMTRYRDGDLPVKVKLRMLEEREAVLRSRPDGETTEAQLNWIHVERTAVIKQLGGE